MTTDSKSSSVLGSDNPSMPEGYFDESKLFEDSTLNPDGTPKDNSTSKIDEVIVDPIVTPNEDADFIKISRKDIVKEIERLRLEDKDFGQVYSRDIGVKAAQRYKPEIERLTRQNEALTIAVKRGEYSGLTQEEVNSKFASDPEFAKDYARVIHAPAPVVETNNDGAILAEAANRVNSMMDFAKGLLTPEEYQVLHNDVATGKFDVDDAGEIIPLNSWREGADKLQAHIVGLTRKSTTPIVTQTEVKPVVATQSIVRQDTANPDMSNGGSRGNTRQTFTMTQVRNMGIEEKIKRFPGENGIEEAVASGEIVLEGI